MAEIQSLGSAGARRVGVIGIIFLAAFIFSCGKKGPPTLKSYEKPASPSLLSAVHRQGRIRLAWSYPNGSERLSGFAILRAGGAEPRKISIKPDLRNYADRDFTFGMTYRYSVVAISDAGIYGSESNFVEITPAAPPPAPGMLSYRLSGDDVVLLWESIGSDVLYNVYRSFEKQVRPGAPLNGKPVNKNSFTDRVIPDRNVYYAVTGVRNSASADEGPESQEIEVSPKDFIPPAPSNLQVFPTTDRIFLLWEGPGESWITGYRVYRRMEGQEYRMIGETPIPSYVDPENPHLKRDYRVVSVGPSKEGPAVEKTGVVFTPEK